MSSFNFHLVCFVKAPFLLIENFIFEDENDKEFEI